MSNLSPGQLEEVIMWEIRWYYGWAYWVYIARDTTTQS